MLGYSLVRNVRVYQVPKAVLFHRDDKQADIGADEKFKFTVP